MNNKTIEIERKEVLGALEESMRYVNGEMERTKDHKRIQSLIDILIFLMAIYDIYKE